MLSAILFLSILFIIGIRTLRPQFRSMGFFAGSVIFALWLVCISLYVSSVSMEHNDRSAVIIEPSVEVKYSPSYTGAVAFKLTEGIKVNIVRQENDWTQIRLTKSKSGWVPSFSVEKI